MGPLARRSLLRLPRSGIWAFLVAGAFLLLALAAAAAPLFAEAAANAALIGRLATVPPGALAADAPVVRIVGGQGTAGRGRIDGALNQIPGLAPGIATAASIGLETRRKDDLFTPFIAAGTKADLADDPNLQRVRIFGDDDLAHTLRPAPGSPPPTARPVSAASLPAVWVPAPVATALRVTAGDRVTVGVRSRHDAATTGALVAGVYAVGPDGRLPADPPGSKRWSYRRGDIPVDTEFTTLPAYLLLTDVAGAERLARASGDELLYSIEGQLRPAHPTLDQAAATVAGIRAREVELRDPGQSGEIPLKVRQQVISGLPTIVADARRVADRSVAWTKTIGTAGRVLGLLAVLAVAVFGLLRRSIEVRHATGLGVHPATIGALAAVEMLAVAVLCGGAGLLLGWLLVAGVGPAGAITSSGVNLAARDCTLMMGAGVLLVAAAATVTAIRAEQLTAQDRRSRSMPWEALLLAIAITASAGLFLRPQQDGPPSLLDLLVPVLVLAAAGAVGARLALHLITTVVTGAGLSFDRRPVPALAARRVAAGGQPAVLLITVLTLGFGFLIYSLAAASSVRQVTSDRAAVLAGAAATATVDASWLLDSGAAQLPPPPPGEQVEVPLSDQKPVPGARVPPLPAGMTMVWRGRISVPPEYGNLDLLVVDPGRFAEVASWGTGPELARARDRVRAMAAADATVAARQRAGGAKGPIPALGVGAVLQRPGDEASISSELDSVPITVMDVVPAFPGVSGDLPVIVVPADSFFSYLGTKDPRVRPPARSGSASVGLTEYFPSLWSSVNLDSIQALLGSRQLVAQHVSTFQEFEQEPDLVAARGSTGYQVALGLCVAGLAMLGLSMFADRSVTRARAADLMLTRMGMGRGGTGRARALELTAFAVVSLILAGIGVGAVVPFGARLLDPGGGGEPAFTLRLDRVGLAASVLAVVLAVLLALVVARSRGSASATSTGAVLRDAE
jgi:hypothetical protein